MTRDAVKRTNQHGGLYASLADREERAVANGGTLSNAETGTSYDADPKRLAALRAGRAVSMPVGDLPPNAGIGLDTGWRHRVLVQPNGSIGLYLDDGSEWLAENGL